MESTGLEKTNMSKVVLLLFITIILLLPLSLIPDESKVAGVEIKKVDIFLFPNGATSSKNLSHF